MDNSKIFLKFSKKYYIDTGHSLHSTVSQGLNRDLLKTLRHSRFAGFQPSIPTRNAPAWLLNAVSDALYVAFVRAPRDN